MITQKEIVSIFKTNRDLKANFNHFCGTNLYYDVVFNNVIYQFAITTDPKEVGTTTFDAEMRATPLLRYIRKALESNELIKIG